MTSDIWDRSSEVYYWPKYDNLIIINSVTLWMFATMEGPSKKKSCVIKDDAIAEHGLIYVGEL